MINLVRRFELKSLAWPIIEFVLDPVALRLDQTFHAAPLGQVLTNQFIEIFVRAAFPRVIRHGEIANPLRVLCTGRSAASKESSTPQNRLLRHVVGSSYSQV